MASHCGLSLIHEAETSEAGDESSDFDIVFIHGLNGDSSSTWTSQESAVFWPRDLLPRSLPKFRVLTFGYQFNLGGLTASLSISSVGEDLLESVIEDRVHNSKFEQKNRRLIFVSHSLGGLVVKQALLLASASLEDNRREVVDSTTGIVFFGTPHRGSSGDIDRVLQYCVSIGTGRRKLSSGNLLFGQLSSQLGQLQEEFREFHTREAPKFQIISFFEELPDPEFGLVVQEDHPISTWITHLPIRANHENLCKFSDPREPNYQRVVGELKKLSHTLHTELKTRTVQNLEGFQKLRDWLKVDIDYTRRRVSPAATNTCGWLFQHQDYKSWKESCSNSLLWISGIPGSGKTVLCSHLIDRLNNDTSEIPQTTVAYFYFDWYRDPACTTASALLQSFIFQILSQMPSAMSELVPLLSQLRDRYTKPDESRGMRSAWLPENHSGVLEKSLMSFSKKHRLCLFIDALDECPDENSAGVLSLLSRLASDNSGIKEHPVKICITSRPHRHMESIRRPWHRKIILEVENAQDIRQYVKSRISKVPRFLKWKHEESIINDVQNIILEKAHGMFLWVKLSVESLLHTEDTLQTCKNFLMDFPEDLNDMYSRILDRFHYEEPGTANLVEEVLRWSSFAYRPLSVDEMCHALGAGQAWQELCTNGLYASFNRERAPSVVDKSWLIDHCWGLIELHEPGPKIQLVHRSALEYLKETRWKTKQKQDYSQMSNLHLAETCALYLLIDADLSRREHKSSDMETDGFLGYAMKYWHEHTRLADSPDLSHTNLLKILSWPSTNFLGHWAHLHQKGLGCGKLSGCWGWTALHISAAFGLHSLALAIRDMDQSEHWDIRDAVGRTPLSVASEKGDLPLVKLILDAGANTASKDLRHGLSPLAWAASRGNTRVIEMLLQEGAEVNDHFGGSTALQLVAARGYETALKLLLSKGANPNSTDKWHGLAALHHAARNGNVATVCLLLAAGADPNMVNPYTGHTALYYATAGDHIDTVEELLEPGASLQSSTSGRISSDNSLSSPPGVASSLLEQFGSASWSCPRSRNSSTTSPVPTTAGSQSAASGTNEKTGTGSKKRNRDDEEPGTGRGLGGSGNEPNKQPTLKIDPSSSSGELGLRLACPYHKYDPERYGSLKSCRGQAGQWWPSVNRVKEHLYKHHFVHICQRCYLIFQDPEALDTHYKAATPCSANLDRDYGDGFDEKQRKQLKARTAKRAFKGNELEYWKGVYRILFPLVEITSIPSPTYEEDNMSKKLYDQSCARARAQDPVLRSRMLQIMNDPTQLDVVRLDSLLALIESHQASSVTPIVPRTASPFVRASSNSNNTTRSGLPVYQPLAIGDSSFNFEWSPLPQISTPLFPQQLSSQPDSRFYSGSSGITDGGSISFHRPSADVQTAFVGDHIGLSGPTTVAPQTKIQGEINIDEFLAQFQASYASVPGTALQQGSSAGEGNGK